MGKRNIYKDIVIAGVLILCILFLAEKAKAWRQAQEMCGITMQSGSELTAEIIAELEKLPGMVLFLPADIAIGKLELEGYTLETEIMGIRLEEYPLQWETAQPQIRLGNTPMLFLGKECFASFQDQYGHPPTKSQIEKWQQGYSQLELALTDENGYSQTARICGILKSPAAQIYMEKAQMEENFGQLSRAKGGYLQIQGRQNAKKAQELLEGAGFQAAEEAPL